MIFVFEIISRGSDLDGEQWEFQDTSRVRAEARADERLVYTFGAASKARRAITSLKLIGTRTSKTAALVTLEDDAPAACGGWT